jgi:hypothetical protein
MYFPDAKGLSATVSLHPELYRMPYAPLRKQQVHVSSPHRGKQNIHPAAIRKLTLYQVHVVVPVFHKN